MSDTTPQPTLPDLAEPSDAEVQAAARALIEFDGTGWGSLGPVGRNTYSNAARAALVAAREVAGR